MKPEAQRIAIAEFCGWKRVKQESGLAWGSDADKNKCWMFAHQLPNYLNDLNAMQKAEKSLDRIQRAEYLLRLHDLTAGGHIFKDSFDLVCATAAQRAEAFLRAIGKWTDEP